MTKDKLLDAYDRGFTDGLKWVAEILRHSALIVEQPTYGEYEKGNGGPAIRAISQVGQVHYARQLREVARTIEEAIHDPAASDPH